MKFLSSMFSHLYSIYQRYTYISYGLFLLSISLYVYFNQQATLNFWLSRDQQAMIHLNQNNTEKAASTFTNKSWQAYSYYMNSDFEQAAKVYATIDSQEAKFSQANALAQYGDYFTAAKLYREILQQTPEHEKAKNNLALMDEIIADIKKNPSKKKVGSEVTNERPKTMAKGKVKGKSQPAPSHELWLNQVQQDPSKFLRKKFEQEAKNAEK